MMPDRNDLNDVPDSPLCTGDPLAKALAGLEPMPSSLNRDALMFAAGGTRRDGEVKFWKRIVVGQATAFGLLVVVGLSSEMFTNSTTRGSWSAKPNSGAVTYPPGYTKPIATPSPPPINDSPTPERLATLPESTTTPDIASHLKYLQLRADVIAAGISILPNPQASSDTVDVGQLEDSLQMPRGTFASYGLVPKPKRPAPNE